jgi:DNA-binding NarL/FixJ family response regulator
MIQILLADDHDVVRRGIRNLLEVKKDWQVVGEARDGVEAVDQALKLKPHIAILDLQMPRLGGLEAAKKIRASLPKTEILIFTMHDTEELVRLSLAAGARGYVLKSDVDRYLISAVESLIEHKPFFTSHVAETILTGFLRGNQDSPSENHPAKPLTERELQVVKLVADHKSSKEIANTLGISVKTVESHRSSIMRKLGVNSTVELVRFAIRNHIVEP